ncbi:M48 family metallopeptidase [Halocynthiibacter sp. C4]|uniref:M48 family metallopeptidase n=1 Tax=Halocynthiibacter sp. C4 TaxID=2992758 RepID=UPI00237A19B5|nr:M48 family metallopeptidase [Halocynthiibacter sp. C4]MDE0590244.1 M48 family metallopeptidase [Halocynthiibacter sp. C4]
MRFRLGKFGMAALVSGMALAGCVQTTPTPQQQAPQGENVSRPASAKGVSRSDFSAVVSRVEPVAERTCKQYIPKGPCDFLIVFDDRKGQPANAFQFVNKKGRPVLVVTAALLESMYNRDEIAFVVGHEAAHHIRGHLAQQQQLAMGGAMIGGLAAAVFGGNASAVEAAQNLGGFVGSRQFSKQHELEADRLGAVIAERAGYNAMTGVLFFTRLPDPGDQFLGSHPANPQRIRAVQNTVLNM